MYVLAPYSKKLFKYNTIDYKIKTKNIMTDSHLKLAWGIDTRVTNNWPEVVKIYTYFKMVEMMRMIN